MSQEFYHNLYVGCGVFAIAMVVLAVVLEIVLDAIVAAIIHAFPNKYFEMQNKMYDVSKKERKFYDKLNIKLWKDKVWELGALGGFRKNKINDPNNPNYIKQFIYESNKGVAIHLVSLPVGFLIMLFPLPKYFLVIGLPIALVNLFLNGLSTMVLRYNIPKLKVAFLRAEKLAKAEKETKEINIEENKKSATI